MRRFVIFAVLVLAVCGGCTGGGGTTSSKSTDWDTLTLEAAAGNMTESQLIERYDVWKGKTPGIYGMGSSEKVLTNIQVDSTGRVIRCTSWLGSPDEMFWNAMASVLMKRYGAPFSVQMNQVMWLSEVELIRPLPNSCGVAAGKIELRWPLGGGSK